MGARYSRIRRASRLAAAALKLADYYDPTKPKPSYPSRQQPRPAYIPVYFKPFSFDLDTTQVMRSTTQEVNGWQSFSGAIGARAKIALAAGEVLFFVEGFKPARVTVTTGVQPSGTPETSQVTGLRYLKYGGTSVSVPFGKTGTETAAEAYTAVKAALTLDTRRVSIRPERVSV